MLAREGTLSGRVLAQGAPVTSFRLRVQSVTFSTELQVSSPDGRYLIAGVPRMSGDLEVVAPGFLLARESVVVPRGEAVTDVDFGLERGSSIAGWVFDQDTALPLGRAWVSVRSNPDVMPVRSDALGRFLLDGLKPGRVEVSVDRSGYRTREVVLGVGSGDPVRIGLTPATRSSGESPEYEGVGMQFESRASPDEGLGYRVSALHREGGARVAGVEVGDEILAAEGVLAGSVPTDEFLRQIKGTEGTVVTLTVRRAGRVFDLHAVRRRLRWDP
ncbi:MAG: carboxypeptidase regulatory-like domain-containing protein [Archangium sp.]|nr:carboxypeptidase regulatory-like domain-containing protein [Archangium sp.]